MLWPNCKRVMALWSMELFGPYGNYLPGEEAKYSLKYPIESDESGCAAA